jgi:NAD(P)-dependent dehydrogenase (short-subunit alcohol dehydrogenase family)
MFVADLLKGKRILVTGGGTGLGRSIGRRYLELGADLVICGRREAVLQTAARELAAETGGRVSHHVCDVRDAAAVAAMMEAIWQEAPLDALVNNAAGNFIARTETLSPRAFDAVLNIVLHGSAYCTLEAGKRWLAEGRKATVLSIVTVGAFTAGPYTAPSAAAKAGVLALMRSLAVEWGPKGIRTVAVAPGLFPTPGAWERLFPPDAIPEPQEAGVPLRRLGAHRELADLCAYLMADGAGYINGDCITIDGGRWLQGASGATARTLAGWDEAQWEAFRARSKG